MELVVFTNPKKTPSEIDSITAMFENGLQTLHVRKPKYGIDDMDDFLRLIPKQYQNRIVLHSHHKLGKVYNLKGIHMGRTHREKKYSSSFKFKLMRMLHSNWTVTRSCHRLISLQECDNYDYVFLSPMYDSISKENYSNKFSPKTVKNMIEENNIKVFALGGVDIDKFEELRSLNFTGVAMLGAIWQSNHNPLSVFKEAQQKLASLKTAIPQ